MILPSLKKIILYFWNAGGASHTKMIWGFRLGVILGILANLFCHDVVWLNWTIRQLIEPIGQLFLRLIFMLVVPLVVTSVTVAISKVGTVRALTKMGLSMLIFTFITAGIGCLIALLIYDQIQPASYVSKDLVLKLKEYYSANFHAIVHDATAINLSQDHFLGEFFRSIVPQNIFSSLVQDPPDLGGIIFFSVFLGLALRGMEYKRKEVAVHFLEAIYHAILYGLDIIMKLAPYAVFCMIFTVTSQFGVNLLVGMGMFICTVLSSLLLQLMIVYPAFLYFLGGFNPIDFYVKSYPVTLAAFATASSSATYPTTLKIAKEKFRLPSSVASFILSIGITSNQAGTAIFTVCAVLFLADLSQIPLSFDQSILLGYLAIFGGVGTPGVPSGALPMVAALAITFNLNPEMVAILLGVERLLDMCRTVLNVLGDLVLVVILSRKEVSVETAVKSEL